jgi:hypothetical protein
MECSTLVRGLREEYRLPVGIVMRVFQHLQKDKRTTWLILRSR